MEYKELTEVPAYEKPIWGDDQRRIPSDTGLPLWSCVNPPPAIGQCVNVMMNGIGPARVTGYFVEGDWLGLLVLPLDPPEFLIRQLGYNKVGHCFGAEIAPDTIPEPVFKDRPNLEQLEALQRFADSRGRMWKSDLNTAWMNGADAREDGGHLLRQVRNTLGPKWLHSKKNTIKPKDRR